MHAMTKTYPVRMFMAIDTDYSVSGISFDSACGLKV